MLTQKNHIINNKWYSRSKKRLKKSLMRMTILRRNQLLKMKLIGQKLIKKHMTSLSRELLTIEKLLNTF